MFTFRGVVLQFIRWKRACTFGNCLSNTLNIHLADHITANIDRLAYNLHSSPNHVLFFRIST